MGRTSRNCASAHRQRLGAVDTRPSGGQGRRRTSSGERRWSDRSAGRRSGRTPRCCTTATKSSPAAMNAVGSTPGRGMRSLPDDSVDRPCQSRPTHGRCGASMRWDTRCPRGARSSCRTCSPQVFCYVISRRGDVHCVNRSFIGRRQAESMSSPQYAVNILCFIGSGRQEVRGGRIERARGARGSRPAWCAAGKRGSTGNRLTRKPIRCWR